MKVNGHHQHQMNGAAMRHAAKARSDTAATNNATAPAPATPAATPTRAAAPAPVESTVDMAVRKLPPGLVRVAARFGAMGVEGRSGGQSNIETQGVATSPAPLPNAPVVLPAVAGSSTDTVAPAETPSDGDVAATDAAPEAHVELAGPVLV
jgi:hypothetical protein